MHDCDSVGPACRAGLSPQGELHGGRMTAQRRHVVIKEILDWSQVATSREVLSGRKDLLWLQAVTNDPVSTTV